MKTEIRPVGVQPSGGFRAQHAGYSPPTMSKVVVVTGASAGVGRAAANAFAERGDRVALIARGGDSLQGAARDVSEAGGEALVVAADVAEPGQVDDAATTIEAELGEIDVWVNDAMATVIAALSSRLDRRWHTAEFRSNRRTAGPSMRSRASRSQSAPSFYTTGVAST